MKARKLTPAQEKERAQIARITYKVRHAHHEADGMCMLIREFGYDLDSHVVSYSSDGNRYGYFIFHVDSEEEMEAWKKRVSKKGDTFAQSFIKMFNVEFNINGRRLRTIYKEWMRS